MPDGLRSVMPSLAILGAIALVSGAVWLARAPADTSARRLRGAVRLPAAAAADFEGLRGIGIGDACSAAFEMEVGNGSVPIRSLREIQDDDLVVFRGTHDGREVVVGYTCVEGAVTEQLVTFRLPTEGEAQAAFELQYQALVDAFGPPCTDWRNLSLWQRFMLWVNGLYFPDALTSVDWRLGNDLEARLDATPIGPGPDYWSVYVAVSHPLETIVRDRDGSERRLPGRADCLHGR